MDQLALLDDVMDNLSRLVDGTTEEQLTNKTPCTEWTVRDVINHMAGGATMFAICADKGSIADDRMAQLVGGDNLGGDFKASFAGAVDEAMGAFKQPGILEKVVKLPFGEMPAGVALTIVLFDLTTHATDLSRSTDQAPPDDQLLETALGIGKQVIGPDFRHAGLFDPEIIVAGDAPAIDRLVAFAGRQP